MQRVHGIIHDLYLVPLVQNGHCTVASECIRLYFSLDPPANQFLIRALLCEGLIAAPSNPFDEESWVSILPLRHCCIESLKNLTDLVCNLP